MLFSFIAVGALLASYVAGESQILRLKNSLIIKPSSQAAESLALVFVQADDIAVDQYVKHLSILQESLNDDVAVWVALPEFSNNKSSAADLKTTVPDVVQQMQIAGMMSSKVIVAGHLQGGVTAQGYVTSFSGADNFNLAGTVLLGSFWSRDQMTQLNNVAIPSLTVSAELDGVARVTRFMEAFYHQVLKSSSSIHPVVVIPGVSHSQYFTGEPTAYMKSKDLKPEVSDQQAYELIMSAVASFITSQVLRVSFAELQSRLVSTNTFFQPLIKSFQYEGFYYFASPCYVKQGPGCLTESPFVSQAAQAIVGDTSKVKVVNQDQMQNIDEILPHDYLPEIFNKCAAGSSGMCTLNTSSVTTNNYEKLSSPDIGDVASSAQNMAVKMNSRQKIYQAAGLDSSDFNALDGISLCRLVNVNAYKWALSNAGSSSAVRFQNIGQALEFGEDSVTVAGIYPLWDLASLSFKENTSNGKMTVVSPALAYSVSMPLTGGYHDCKLLSPARAMEWIYVDGLRAHAVSQ
eukprot:TRINITY_DN4929_c0_g2_i2.p1 TRINITY_DN4929_c0_g2~~TRINITY_DN4929_c0_g2_i2.p1  ORF type:complete len:518 (-),score=160.23 TRINITY_DN4929_c0_g2_i2:1090-2643(-)